MLEYVWYASYGSNINRDRFLCYILGGTPVGSSKREMGCRDTTLPLQERSFEMPHELYFAKKATKWQGKGVAFIDIEANPLYHTYSRMYLITRDQFIDIVRQENNHAEDLELDLESIVKKGSFVFRETSWYGNVLCVGEEEGHPIFTFTSSQPVKKEEINAPSHEYLSTILKGIRRDMGKSREETLDYIKRVKGITPFYSMEELQSLDF